MQVRSLSLLVLSSTLLFAACRKEAEPVKEAPKPHSSRAMQAAADATAKRLQDQAARWTARHAFSGGRTLEVEVLQVPNGPRRMEFTVVGRDGKRGMVARIIERDRLWYVTEGDTSAVYQPYQAPLQLPGLYVYLARSELQFFHAEGHAALGAFVGIEKDVATYRAELPEGMRERLELMAAAAEKADAAESASEARKLVTEGLQTRVNVQTGVIVRAGAPGAETEVDGPHFFVTPPSDASFDVGDLVPGLLAASPRTMTQSLVMFAHCGAWQPGAPGCDLDAVVLELKHGALRRVPYLDGTSLPGSFLKDRLEVLVSGTDVAGGMRPVLVHLEHGGQRTLGGAPLAQGMTLFPTASHDGTRAVATWLPALDARDQARVVLFDLAGGDATTVGEPMEHSHVQWLPGDQGFLLTVRKAAEPGGPTEPSIARLSLDGTLKVLRKGDQPLLLSETSLLFYDRDAKAWMRAKADGTGAVRFGSGHTDLSSPTLSPDGKELLFLKRIEGGGHVPARVDLEGKTVTPLMVEGGLWAWPRW